MGISSSSLRFRLKYPNRMLKVPSGFGNQPSYAAVTLWPESCGGSTSCCCCAIRTTPRANKANPSRCMVDLIAPGQEGGKPRGPMLRGPILIILVGDVGDVHPGVGHLIDCAIAPADPLIGIGIVFIRRRIIVPGHHV